MENTIMAWEQQDEESTEAYEAFKVYRDMGVARSCVKVGEVLGKSATLIERWSSHWRWVERVRQWDMAKDRQKTALAMDEVEQMARRHTEAAAVTMQAIIQPAYEFMRRWQLDRDGVEERLKTMTDKEVLHLVIQASRVLSQIVATERMVRGLPENSGQKANDAQPKEPKYPTVLQIVTPDGHLEDWPPSKHKVIQSPTIEYSKPPET